MLQRDGSDSDNTQSEEDCVEDATDDGSESSCSSDNNSRSRRPDEEKDDDDDEKLQVHVKLVGKETSESFWIDPSSLVGDLKRQIATRYSVPMERQRLIFFGKMLLDNAQALGPKGACMRLGTINYVHLSPLPEGAKPSDRPISKLQPPPAQTLPRAYEPHSANNHRERNNDTDRSSVSGLHHEVPTALPVPNLSLGAQLARARRLGTQARRRRRRLEEGPYPYTRLGMVDDSVTPDDSFSSELPMLHRYHHLHRHHPHSARADDEEEEEILRRHQSMGGSFLAQAPFLAPSFLSQSILAHQPIFAPTSVLVSRRPEWSNPFLLSGTDIASHSYPYHLTSTSRDSNNHTSTPSSTTTPDDWTDLRASRDRLERQRRQQQRVDEESSLRRDILQQQVQRSALQLLPAVAEWYAQLERLSQWSPSSSAADDTSLIQDTLDQMDVGIIPHWISRLRPSLVMTLHDASPTLSTTRGTTPSSLFSSPWIPPPTSMASSSTAVPSPLSSMTPGVRYF